MKYIKQPFFTGLFPFDANAIKYNELLTTQDTQNTLASSKIINENTVNCSDSCKYFPNSSPVDFLESKICEITGKFDIIRNFNENNVCNSIIYYYSEV